MSKISLPLVAGGAIPAHGGVLERFPTTAKHGSGQGVAHERPELPLLPRPRWFVHFESSLSLLYPTTTAVWNSPKPKQGHHVLQMARAKEWNGR